MKDLGKALNVNTSLRILKLGRNIIKELDLEILLTALTTSSSLYILGLEVVIISILLIFMKLNWVDKDQVFIQTLIVMQDFAGINSTNAGINSTNAFDIMFGNIHDSSMNTGSSACTCNLNYLCRNLFYRY